MESERSITQRIGRVHHLNVLSEKIMTYYSIYTPTNQALVNKAKRFLNLFMDCVDKTFQSHLTNHDNRLWKV